MKAKHWSGRIPRASDARSYHDEQGTPPTSPYISSNDGAMGQAAARCSTPIKGGALGSGEYYRFCLNVNRSSNSTISFDSYWNTAGSNSSSFIELMMIPVSLPSDKPISCATFQASKQNGLKVLYTVWRHNPIKASTSSTFDVKHEDGFSMWDAKGGGEVTFTPVSQSCGVRKVAVSLCTLVSQILHRQRKQVCTV